MSKLRRSIEIYRFIGLGKVDDSVGVGVMLRRPTGMTGMIAHTLVLHRVVVGKVIMMMTMPTNNKV